MTTYRPIPYRLERFARWRSSLTSIDRLYVWSALIGLAAASILIEIAVSMQSRVPVW